MSNEPDDFDQWLATYDEGLQPGVVPGDLARASIAGWVRRGAPVPAFMAFEYAASRGSS